MSYYSRFGWPVLYISLVAFCNYLLIALPVIQLGPTTFLPPVMFIVGFVFVVRDFTQRVSGHWVLLYMAMAIVVSYWTATPEIALASALAFSVSETVDWAIFTITKKRLSDRILISSLFSVPVDTMIILYALGIFDIKGVLLITFVKMIATFVIWGWLKYRESEETTLRCLYE